MAAPSGTTWGSIVSEKARIGLYVTTSNTNTQTKVTAQVWFWSKWAVKDSANNFYFNWDSTSASTNRGDVSINVSVTTGSGWSTSNQQRLATYTKTYNRGTSSASKSCAAALNTIEVAPGTMRVSKSFSVPALSSYKITYNANGGSGAPGQQTKYYGKTLTLSKTKPTRENHSFLGWATSSSATSAQYQPGGSYTANSAVTLYAVWAINSYVISYDANKGVGAPDAQTTEGGGSIVLTSSEPTRKRHSFLGWATSSSATSAQYQPGGSYTFASDVDLFAVWELIDDSIKLYSNITCEAVEFVEGESSYFQSGGIVCSPEFIEVLPYTSEDNVSVTFGSDTAGDPYILTVNEDTYTGQEVVIVARNTTAITDPVPDIVEESLLSIESDNGLGSSVAPHGGVFTDIGATDPYIATVTDEEYAGQEVTLKVKSTTTEPEPEPEPEFDPKKITIKVVDEAGNPVKGLKVYMTPDGEESSSRLLFPNTTDTSGISTYDCSADSGTIVYNSVYIIHVEDPGSYKLGQSFTLRNLEEV